MEPQLPQTMDALVFKGKCAIAFEQVPVPRLEQPGDAVVRIELCGLCGSDLHPYHCREEGLDEGTVMGHEFVGRVVAAGPEVQRFKPGDRVMSPFTANCGACFYCRRGLTARCERSKLFGWVEGGKGLHGAQAQLIRVPMADATLAHVPADVSDEEALLLGDIFSTGFFAADNAGIAALAASYSGAPDAAPSGEAGGGEAGPVVAVVGCGPVGVLACIGARELGAARVFAIDSVPDRLALAARFGAEPLNREQCDPQEAVRAATGGRGADAVLEVVGAPSALRSAYDLVRPGGTISSVGCHTAPEFPFSPTDCYNKNVTLKSGRCSARHYMDRLLPLVQSKKYNIAGIVSHRLPLSDGPAAYRLFDGKAAGCTKVVMRPWPEAAEVAAADGAAA
ncbi:alcohol dehydrogenase [Chlorella sorokiniana]|uniref:Alcohol dehydrogenase n=1 Tax=Chlorella sorokiniana TaxID=3076 RepID=A0A2P6TUJ8_CHLSO|nr:alcohol dehydrogenase [Chlorella sorokiniana]|eukprot:PRW57739.1 alcohol dehydrogenase [Chlorella sorokiniana]